MVGSAKRSRAAQLREWARWFAWSALSFPLGVLSHELAHFVAYVAFGFPAARMHFSSSSFGGREKFWALVDSGNRAAAATQLPLWKVALGALAGPLATYVTIVVCLVLVRRRPRPHPLIVALLVVAPLRFVGSLFTLLRLALHRPPGVGSDEAHAAALLTVPETLLHVLGVAVLVVSVAAALRAARRERPAVHTTALAAGVITGGIIYAFVVGPRVLP